MGRPNAIGVLFLVTCALVYAVVLDRYAAAFLPTGSRLLLMFWLLPGTVPFMLADQILAVQAAVWQRILARIVPIAALAANMATFPQSMELIFTVLPVPVLFFCVYGAMARALALRTGPEAAGFGLAFVLAWSIAASTPLFAG